MKREFLKILSRDSMIATSSEMCFQMAESPLFKLELIRSSGLPLNLFSYVLMVESMFKVKKWMVIMVSNRSCEVLVQRQR